MNKFLKCSFLVLFFNCFVLSVSGAVTKVQVKSGIYNGGSTTATASFTSGTTSGNIVIVAVSWAVTSGTTTLIRVLMLHLIHLLFQRLHYQLLRQHIIVIFIRNFVMLQQLQQELLL